MKEYRIVTKTIWGGYFYKNETKERARIEEKEIEDEINTLAKNGWILKSFNIISYSEKSQDLHYYTLLERDT